MSAIPIAKPKLAVKSLLALLVVVALVALAMVWAPSSARADDTVLTEGETSSDVVVDTTAADAAAKAAEGAAAADAEAARLAAEAEAVKLAEAEAARQAAEADAAKASEVNVTEEVNTDSEAADTTDTSEPVVAPAADESETVFDPSMQRTIFESSHCVIGLVATQNIPANLVGAYWALAAPDGTNLLGATEYPVQSGVTLKVPVTQDGIYDASINYPALDRALYVGHLEIECIVPFGDPFVDITNETAEGGVETGTVGFDYAVVNGVDETNVSVLIYPAGDQSDTVAQRDLTVTGSGNKAEQFPLAAGDYCAVIVVEHNFGGDVDGRAPVTECLPFTVTEKEEPGATEPTTPTVTGNTVNIIDQPGFVFFDKDTKKPVKDGDTIEEGQTLCIMAKAKSNDPYGEKGDKGEKFGPWCFEYLPKDGVKERSSVVNDCVAGVKATLREEAKVTYTRGPDGKVTETIGEFLPVGPLVPVVPTVPLTEEELGDCPGGEPGTPGEPGDGETPGTPGTPGGSDNGNGSSTASSVKALAETGGPGLLWGLAVAGAAGLLIAAGVRLQPRRQEV